MPKTSDMIQDIHSIITTTGNAKDSMSFEDIDDYLDDEQGVE